MTVRIAAGALVVVSDRAAFEALNGANPPAGVFATAEQLPTIESRLRVGETVAVPASAASVAMAAARRFDAPTVAFGFTPARPENFDLVVPTATPDVCFIPAGSDLSELTVDAAVIGDVHGCVHTLDALLAALDAGRFPIYVGDLHDKGGRTGQASVDVLRRVMAAHRRGECLMVRGNHEAKLARVLARDTPTAEMRWGLGRTVEAIRSQPDADALSSSLQRWITHLPTMLVLNGGDLVVAHAAVIPELIGSDNRRDLRRLEAANLYGVRPPKDEPQHEPDSGLPIRVDWAQSYSGHATVVHGHVIVDAPRVLNGVVNVDTGCYAGGGLTAYVAGAGTFVSVPTAIDDLTVERLELLEVAAAPVLVS